VEADLAAEEMGELAADREPEAGAAVAARRAGIGLLERLEDDLLLLGRDADAGVADREAHHRPGLAEHRMVGAPAAVGGRDLEPHATRVGELEGVGEQVLEHLQQPLRVGGDRASEPRVELARERELARLGDVAEVALDRLAQAGERQLLGLDRDRPRLDLREIEDVADEVEEIGAGAVDGAGEFDLLRSR
jgi:hypothetical protein